MRRPTGADYVVPLTADLQRAAAGAPSAGNVEQPMPWNLAPPRLDEKERRRSAVQILKLLCDTPLLQGYLLDLLTAKLVV